MTNPTTNLVPQNAFSTQLSSPMTTTDTVAFLAVLPTATEGYLTIDEGLTTQEVFFYNAKGSNFVTIPTLGDRGLQGSTSGVSAHSSGAGVKEKTSAQYYQALQNGYSLAQGAITPSKLGTGAAAASVATSETTASTTYVQLTTTTDTDTVTIGANGLALVSVSATLSNNTGGAVSYMGFAVSGASTVAAADAYAVSFLPGAGGQTQATSGTFLVTGLTAGSTTFGARYRVSSNTGTFSNRRISVVPL